MTQGHHPMEVKPTVKGENFKKTYTFLQFSIIIKMLTQ